MDLAQFKRWFGNHCKRYNAVEGWLRSKPVDGVEGVAGQKDILDAWFSVLSDARIDDAIWATEAMFRGELNQPQGPGFDDHPRTVRRYAMARAEDRAKSGRKAANGERVYECAICSDRGWREIWIPQFLAWAREAFADGPPRDAEGNRMVWGLWAMDQRAKERPRIPSNGVVACNCAAGNRKAERVAMRYDEARHVTYDPRGLEAAIEESRTKEF